MCLVMCWWGVVVAVVVVLACVCEGARALLPKVRQL
jgi:hypothetical protein